MRHLPGRAKWDADAVREHQVSRYTSWSRPEAKITIYGWSLGVPEGGELPGGQPGRYGAQQRVA